MTVHGPSVAEVEARVDLLAKDTGHDPEDAHIREDSLYVDVLRAIASGRSEDPQRLAAAALRTREFIKTRWYA